MKHEEQFENVPFDDVINAIIPNDLPLFFPLHWHKYVEILSLPEDAKIEHPIRISIDNMEYILAPGDILFVWPGELHEIVSNQDKQLVGIQFNSCLFNELPELGAYLHAFRQHHHISFATHTELAQNMNTQILHMLSLKEESGPFHNTQTHIALYELFIGFGMYIRQTNTSVPQGITDTTDKMNIACNYIIERCDQPLTLNTVADHIGFSPYYFSRTFKKTTNYSFVEYLTIQRLKRAQALLADATLSITEICYRSGFKSISTFNRVFLMYKGCSPSNYRKYYTLE